MAYLLTGGMGCIGTYVIRDLLAAGEKVVVYDFAYDLTIPKMVLTEEQIEGFTFVQGILPTCHTFYALSKNMKLIGLSISPRGRCQRATRIRLRH